MYTVPDNGNYETYMVPSSELNPQIPSPVFVNVDRMANDGTPEFVVDPGLYYPATNYGYYCTGYQPSSECDDQHTVFGVQGAEAQYTGPQTENVPCIYYTPGYGYGESPFNPYNPYIPGAMIGADGAYVGTQPYYTISPYASAVSSSGYVPVLVQSGLDADASSSTNTSLDVGSSAKRSQPQSPASFSVNPPNSAPSQAHALTAASQGAKVNTGNSKRPMGSRTNGSSGSVYGVSTDVHQSSNTSVSPPTAGSLSHEKFLPQANTVNQSYAVGRGVSDYGSGTNGQAVFNDPWSQYYYRRVSNDVSGNCDPLGEQNRGPRTNKSKNQFIVKAYTTKAGDCNPEGNITISADSYNKDDFPVDYVNSKFYVIKSYSEDDVHKSVKYNVWSSTPNGNRKLNSAYEEAQKIAAGKPRGCPIFMFFSVNASGQFCGVAEMIGPVDFDKDMDFWQQDKWSGSFPVKWHVIKDVPNPTFRHIILENNEHKPVTNSRDTQEIMYKQGMEMLRLFKNYSSKTSLLDDFMYYEHRQKSMHEERSRLLRKANVNSHAIAPPVKLPFVDETSTTWVEKAVQPNNSSTELSSTTSDVDNQGHRANVSTLKIGSLSIHPKQSQGNSTLSSSLNTTMRNTSAPPANVVTVGSMPVKVDSVNPRTSGILTVGTIPLDPKSLQQGKVGGFGKGGPQR